MTTTTGSKELVSTVMKATGSEEELATLGANFVVARRTKVLQPTSEVAARAVHKARGDLFEEGLFPNKKARKAFFDQLEPLIHR